jgi:hypothetical protein
MATLKLVLQKSNMEWNFDVFLYTVHIYIYITVFKVTSISIILEITDNHFLSANEMV